jgi:hypothetical protein
VQVDTVVFGNMLADNCKGIIISFANVKDKRELQLNRTVNLADKHLLLYVRWLMMEKISRKPTEYKTKNTNAEVVVIIQADFTPGERLSRSSVCFENVNYARFDFGIVFTCIMRMNSKARKDIGVLEH